MATEWYLMGSMPVYNSGYEKEEFNMYAKDSFAEILETSPVSETIQIVNHDLTLVSEIKAVVLNNVADSTTKSIERHLLVTIETLNCGDYINYENNTWLVTSFVGNNGIYEKAIVELCTFTIKFQSLDGTILSYPCIDETTNSVGIDENNTISTLNGIHRIKLPFDDNTKLIKEDRRFFIDKYGTTTAKVTDVNNIEFNYGDKGLIELTLQKDSAYNPQTDINGVCNYFEPTVEPNPPDPEVPTEIVTITSDATYNNIKLGLLYTFSATFTNELGNPVSGVIAEYSLNTTYGGLVVLHDNLNGTCTVQVDDSAYNFLTNEVVLTCMDIAHGFSSSVTLTIIGLF